MAILVQVRIPFETAGWHMKFDGGQAFGRSVSKRCLRALRIRQIQDGRALVRTDNGRHLQFGSDGLRIGKPHFDASVGCRQINCKPRTLIGVLRRCGQKCGLGRNSEVDQICAERIGHNQRSRARRRIQPNFTRKQIKVVGALRPSQEKLKSARCLACKHVFVSASRGLVDRKRIERGAVDGIVESDFILHRGDLACIGMFDSFQRPETVPKKIKNQRSQT